MIPIDCLLIITFQCTEPFSASPFRFTRFYPKFGSQSPFRFVQPTLARKETKENVNWFAVKRARGNDGRQKVEQMSTFWTECVGKAARRHTHTAAHASRHQHSWRRWRRHKESIIIKHNKRPTEREREKCDFGIAPLAHTHIARPAIFLRSAESSVLQR